jgi:hypothetical protein
MASGCQLSPPVVCGRPFEQVCSPSRSDTARKLTESYQKGDFAKRAMLRYCFKDTNVAGDMERCSTILL